MQPAPMTLFLRTINNPNTKRSYEHTLGLFLPRCPDPVTRDYMEIRQVMRDWIFEQGYKTLTARARLSALCAFFKFLQSEGYRKDNPSMAIKIPDEQYDGAMPTFPTLEIINLIIAEARKDSSLMGFRNYAMLMCLRSGGFRVSELIKLCPSDFDTDGKVRIRIAKRNKHRVTGISSDCWKAVEAWIRVGKIKESSLLFNITDRQVNRIIKELSRQAHIAINVSAHGFRHAWATAHVKQNTNQSLLMAMGGWATSRMINEYVVQEGLTPIGI